jgi:hypothetical protein
VDWKKAAESAQAQQIPYGKYDRLRITRILRGKKDGTMFTSKAGSPQMMLVIADTEDRERIDIITLDEKNAWKLAQYLAAVGADLDGMTRDGVGVDAFKDERFALAQLDDRTFAAEIRPDPHNAAYAKIVPFAAQPEKKVDDDIPI